jgi:uncharacterized cupin superfamily protein
MTELSPIRFDRKGREGLHEWEKIPASTLDAGDPVQSGENLFTDDTGKVTAGVWHCTPFTTKLAPYDVNEFMYVLDGSVTIIHENGDQQTIRAGQSFVIPKGTPCVWKQTENILKFYVIFNDDSGKTLETGGLAVRRPDPAAALDPVGAQDTSRYVGGVPKQTIKTYFEDASKQMKIGIWTTTEMHTKPVPFSRNELMHMLEGEVTITDGNGKAHVFRAGDTFMVPKGAMYQWDSTKPVRKIFCVFEPKASVAARPAAAE